MAVAGAELAGLVAGAILARHGLHVILVDTPPAVGGRGGGTSRRARLAIPSGEWLEVLA